MTDRPANRPLTRRVVELYGVVQGVGFRPALHRLATAAGLGGEARNAPDGVRLVLEGPADTVDRFLAALPSRLPPSAEIIGLREVERVALDRPPRREFVIAESDGDGAPRAVIPADLAVCPECARDVFDPADRRYGYPFTTGTRPTGGFTRSPSPAPAADPGCGLPMPRDATGPAIRSAPRAPCWPPAAS
mgnify:CR=1 FL=1